MRFLRTSAVLIMSCGAVAAFGQNTPAATSPTPATATTSKAPVDLTGFKEHIEEKNKALSSQVNTTKAIVKKNTVILEDAKRISAENLRLQAERKALDAQNAEFARESQAMQSETTGVSVPTPPPAAPVRVEPVVPAPRVEPPPPPPARIDTAAVPRVAPIIPARVAPVSAPPPARVETAESIAPPARVAPVAPPPAPVSAPLPAADATVRAADPDITIASRGNAPLARPAVSEAATPSVSTATVSEPVRVSAGVSQGMLLAPIVPVYPSIAISAHIQGEVVMEAIISKEGGISTVRAISGPAMLREAALDAVKVARYRPYSVNGQRTEVAATIKVVFQLSR
jgi:periplasmic protein TonB